MFRILVLVGLLCSTLITTAQPMYQRFDIEVKMESGISYSRAWEGGMNAPQFSNIDLNNDGKQDLFVFEKCDNSVSLYLQTDDGVYTKSHQNYMQLPTDLASWCLLKDYNCDGVLDLFTYSQGLAGAKVYSGSYSPSAGFTYSLAKNVLRFPGGTIDPNIYITQLDLPSFVDMDNDNDVDILTFSFSGDFIEYYQNQSQELGYGCDSLVFIQNTACWGNVKESAIDYTIATGITCKMSNMAAGQTSEPHTGSSITAFDYDYDGDIDVLLGDVSYHSLTHLVNEGTASYATIGSVAYNYPSYSTAVDVAVFPAAFYADVNNDAKKDMLVSTNLTNNTKYLDNVSYYKNIGITNDSFVLVSDSFIIGDMVDVGKNAYPVLIDVNSDGLKDMVVGNNSYYGYPSGLVEESALTLYQNVGTTTQPAYQLITRNWLNTRSYGLTNLFPTFGDLDTDGDMDMVVGTSAGILLFLENISSGASMVFAPPISNYQGIDVGSISAPQLVDVDEDGLLDLLIGEIQGRIFYYKNIGTASAAVFTLIDNKWGEVDVRYNSTTGYSKPHLTKKITSGVYELLVGSECGRVFRYNAIDTISGSTFTKIDSNYLLLSKGKFSSPCIEDIDNDGFFDVIVGNMRGGLCCYTSDTAYLAIDNTAPKVDLLLYPNPTSNGFFVEYNNNSQNMKLLKVLDLSGRLLMYKDVTYSNFIETSNLINGVYVVVLQSNTDQIMRKIIIQH